MADFNAIQTPTATSVTLRCERQKGSRRNRSPVVGGGNGIDKFFQTIFFSVIVLSTYCFTMMAEGAPAAAPVADAYVGEESMVPLGCELAFGDEEYVAPSITEIALRARTIIYGQVLRKYGYRLHNQSYTAEMAVYCSLKGDQKPQQIVKIIDAGIVQ